MAITISVPLDGMTFGDLFDLVDAARAGDVSRSTEVTQIPWSEDDLDQGIQKLELDLPHGIGARPAPDFSDIDRASAIAALDEVIASDGDARTALTTIKDIRDRLI